MPDENEVSLYDYIKVVSKWKWLIVIGIFVCIFTAGVVSLRLPEVYEVSLDLKIGKVWGSSIEEPGLVLETITRESFLAKVINRLNLKLSPQELKEAVKASVIKDNLIRVTVKASIPAKTMEITNAIANLIIENYKDKYNKAMAFYYQYEEDLSSQIAEIKAAIGEMKTTLSILQKNPQTNAPAVILLQAQLEQKESQLTNYIRELRDVRIKNYLEMHSEMTRVESPPVEPSFPVAPQRKRIVLIAAVLGGLVSHFLAFFLEYLAKMKKLEAESKKQKN
jgi:capsular polysaccharide biosynthesis protein